MDILKSYGIMGRGLLGEVSTPTIEPVNLGNNMETKNGYEKATSKGGYVLSNLCTDILQPQIFFSRVI